MTTMQFGPQTKEFATLLDSAKQLTAEQFEKMMALRDDTRCNEAWDHAIQELFDSEQTVETLTTIQFLQMYSSYYPQPVLDAALAVAGRHRLGEGDLSQEDYTALCRPWAMVVGKAHPED